MRLYGVRCQGHEESMLQCSVQSTQYVISYEQCGQNKAGVVCQGKYLLAIFEIISYF